MKTLLIIGTFEALFLILLIISKRERRISDFFLGFIFFSFALSIGFTWLEIFNAENGYPFPWALNISWIFIFLHGPALWFYIKSLSVEGFRFHPVYLLHFVPFAGFFIAQYVAFFSLEPSHRTQLVISNAFQEWPLYKVSVIGIGISTFTYYMWGLKQIRDRRKRLKRHFSRIDNNDLEWLRILIIVSLVVYAGNVGLFNLDLVFDIAPYHVLMLAAYSFASVYILVLGFFGLRQGNVFISNMNAPADPGMRAEQETAVDTARWKVLEAARGKVAETDQGKIAETDQGKQAFIIQLTHFMEEQKPYREPEITLSKLAWMMKVTPEYLSEILNKHLHHSFFDFINQYRVEEFKLECLAGENAHLSIMGIAYNSGFNSKAAFYRAFRKYEKISPTEYMQRLRKK
ncbi:MAG: AraC family transcriptional regulator [Bacteroidales bacterium]|nr:AraC family transcriptional regulator [Bacteroidales bacterium]